MAFRGYGILIVDGHPWYRGELSLLLQEAGFPKSMIRDMDYGICARDALQVIEDNPGINVVICQAVRTSSQDLTQGIECQFADRGITIIYLDFRGGNDFEGKQRVSEGDNEELVVIGPPHVEVKVRDNSPTIIEALTAADLRQLVIESVKNTTVTV